MKTIIDKKDLPDKKSVISKLSDEQHFYIALMSELHGELVEKQIITPSQKRQVDNYIRNRMKPVGYFCSWDGDCRWGYQNKCTFKADCPFRIVAAK